MTSNALTAALKHSISEVLETMFFSSLEFSDDLSAAFENNGGMTCCRIEFSGNLNGTMVVMMQASTLKYLTADFMGLEKHEVEDSFSDGTLKEITNMIAGGAFSHYDSFTSYHLSIPELVDFKSAVDEIGGQKKGVFAQTLEGPIMVRLETDDD